MTKFQAQPFDPPPADLWDRLTLVFSPETERALLALIPALIEKQRLIVTGPNKGRIWIEKQPANGTYRFTAGFEEEDSLTLAELFVLLGPAYADFAFLDYDACREVFFRSADEQDEPFAEQDFLSRNGAADETAILRAKRRYATKQIEETFRLISPESYPDIAVPGYKRVKDQPLSEDLHQLCFEIPNLDRPYVMRNVKKAIYSDRITIQADDRSTFRMQFGEVFSDTFELLITWNADSQPKLGPLFEQIFPAMRGIKHLTPADWNRLVREMPPENRVHERVFHTNPPSPDIQREIIEATKRKVRSALDRTPQPTR